MNINIPRGATKSFTVENVMDNSGALVDMTTARIYFTATVGASTITRRSANASGGGIDQIEPLAPGSFRIKFGHAETQAVTPGVGKWDAWVVTPAGDFLQVLPVGKFIVTEAVTTTFP